MNTKFKNALVSVSDKTGLVEFLKPLQQQGLRIVSTGGTAKHLKENGLKVIDVSEQTGFEEVMDGRVKTLHPNIHMAILARVNNDQDLATLASYELEPFDLIVGNLYPFEQALRNSEKDLTEYIDIGGPSFLRAAAKNYQSITTLCDPGDYNRVLNLESLDESFRQKMAAKVFRHVSSYDALIASTLDTADLNEDQLCIAAEHFKTLRYGENPQQQANWYRDRASIEGIHSASILQGKELSYNNILDLDAAISTLSLFEQQTTAVAVKHLNPCGVGSDSDPDQALEKCLSADPKSVFGGIIALNFPVSKKHAERLSQLFVECIIAPEISKEAQAVFSKKPNVRVMNWPGINQVQLNSAKIRTVIGGYLKQTADLGPYHWNDQWNVLGDKPSDAVKQDLLTAWRIVSSLKSNAISIVKSGQSLGLGMGQVNRVDAVAQAIDRMKHFHPKVQSPVLASDAFFPFADSIEPIAEAGIKWVIQPGGSIRDKEVISMANDLGVNLILTGQRHFQH
ncbi:MAG: bifunctional phosphoribosylaminoimidazolecarboxamide formyltransferase/IMP cyclohydrolase [Bdellovibrionales bacterium]|nr:bifunctional phosphoribosylaminoimidazolecarboxamide formyltransferase/IMP cyclohydrolase [Bdellovibrionales bacterium]